MNNSRNFFWASYADLMTALFIVSLSLFVFSYRMFLDKAEVILQQKDELARLGKELDLRMQEIQERGYQLSVKEEEIARMRGFLVSERALADSLVTQLENERGQLLVMEEEYKKLKEIEKAISSLNPEYFEYQREFKRHVLKTQVQFETGRAAINASYHQMLKNAGLELTNLIKSLEGTDNIKYMLVIEGSASQDSYTRNYELSYERALELYRLWERQGVVFDRDRIEVIVAGSGTGGVGRVAGDERKNQRFLIQIIPKVGTIELKDIDDIRRQVEEMNRRPVEGTPDQIKD